MYLWLYEYKLALKSNFPEKFGWETFFIVNIKQRQKNNILIVTGVWINWYNNVARITCCKNEPMKGTLRNRF